MARAQRMRLNSCNSEKLMLLDLPNHILLDIVSKLPCESVWCVRCVSKALLKTVADISFAPLHTRFLIATNAAAQVPQLMSFARIRSDVSEHDRVLADLQQVKFDGSALRTRGDYSIYASTLPIFNRQTYMIEFVFCNLFCFRSAEDRGPGHCFLIDPLRGEVLRLPRSKDVYPLTWCGRDWYGMGFDSIANTIKVLRVVQVYRDRRLKLISYVLVLGKSSWREIPSTPPCRLSNLYNMDSYTLKNACAYEDMHWLVGESNCRIVSFDFKKEEFCWTPHFILERSSEHAHPLLHFHLLTLRGSLALVDTSLSQGMTTKIEIWLLNDYDKKQWTRDYSLNIDMFDFRKELGLLSKVTCGAWEHGIFFKNFDETQAFFLDLRRDSANIVRCGSGKFTNILSYTRSFICLKDYESLDQADQDARTLKSYGNLIEEEAQSSMLPAIYRQRGYELYNGYRLRVSNKLFQTLQ